MTIQIARGNPLMPHGLLFLISSKGSFICNHHIDRIAQTTSFVTPVMEHWLEQEIAQWVHHEGSIRLASYHGATSHSLTGQTWDETYINVTYHFHLDGGDNAAIK